MSILAEYSIVNYFVDSFEVTTNALRSQIVTLETSLAAAAQEIAAKRQHEAIVTSQFQVSPV